MATMIHNRQQKTVEATAKDPVSPNEEKHYRKKMRLD